MKKIIVIISVLVSVFTFAQKANGVYNWLQLQPKEAVLVDNLFTTENTQPFSQEQIKHYTILQLNQQVTQTLLAQKPNRILLIIPQYNGTNIQLSLAKVQVTSDNFSVKTSDNQIVNYQQGVHYRGIINNDKNSLVSISIFDNDCMGMICNENGNYDLGKIEDNSGKFILYNDKDLASTNPFICDTTDNDNFVNTIDYSNFQETTSLVCRTVNLYWEADYQLYVKKSSSLTTTTNFLTGLFAEMATLYANDNINVNLASTLVWTTADPYPATSSTAALSAFKSQWNGQGNNFGANFAMLVAYETSTSGNGGLAYLNPGYCANANSYGYANIGSTYSSVPTYSWSVEVLTHETGHNLGSSHTHACKWNGNNTAIDSCAPTYNPAYSEGTCPDAGVPDQTVGGTIMSYCHLLSYVGINFVNGFGPQPKALIINKINNATCLTGDQTAYANYYSTVTNNSVAFSNTSLGATSYFWDFGDGQTSTATNPTHVYSDINDYTVCLTATNTCGTTQTCKTVSVTALSVSDISQLEKNIDMFPNPANEVLFVKLKDNSQQYSLQMFDETGKLVFENKALSAENQINTSKLSSGIYFATIKQADGKDLTKKVVISHNK